MRFFLAMYLICIAVTLIAVVVRNKRYPYSTGKWRTALSHKIAVGAMWGSIINIVIVLCLWFKGMTF